MRKLYALIIAVAVLGIGIAVGSSTASAPPSFTFGSSVAGASYECSLDGTAFKSCASPFSTSLKPGAHRFRVNMKATVPTPAPEPLPVTTPTTPVEPPATKSCYGSPASCGFPDPKAGNVGTECAALKASGSLTINTAGETVEGLNISGTVTINAPNVTLTNDCIGAGGGSGSHIVFLASGATGTQITHSDIYGSPGVQEALTNNYSQSGAVADHDYIYNCGECVHGPWTLTNSYVTSNATISGEHYEDIYCSDATFVAEHDVLVNPHEQTANLFCDTKGGGGGPADNHITLKTSLLAGAGFSLYPDGNSSSAGSSTMTVTGNRFARCSSTPVFNSQSGGTACKNGPDANGLFPNGGYFGIDAYTYCSSGVWSQNVWDDSGTPVGC